MPRPLPPPLPRRGLSESANLEGQADLSRSGARPGACRGCREQIYLACRHALSARPLEALGEFSHQQIRHGPRLYTPLQAPPTPCTLTTRLISPTVHARRSVSKLAYFIFQLPGHTPVQGTKIKPSDSAHTDLTGAGGAGPGLWNSTPLS